MIEKIVVLALVVIGLLMAFLLVDACGITATKTATAAVDKKEIVPPFTTIIVAGDVLIPQFYPESYLLHFRIDGSKVSSEVEKGFFDDIRVGDSVEVDYGVGRLSGAYKPTQIRRLAR